MNPITDEELYADDKSSLEQNSRRRKTTVKAKCPCCVNSSSPDRSLRKEDHVKAKGKTSCDLGPANKKIKLNNNNDKDSKKNMNQLKKMVTEIVGCTDKKTNCIYYSCPTCSYLHKSKDELTMHWREKHSVSKNAINEIHDLMKLAVSNRNCKTCQKMLEEENNINKHIIWHRKSTASVNDCILCSMLYNKLKEHIRNHAPYICRVCTKGFTSDIDLNNHLITHLYDSEEQEGTKRCKLCTKIFNSIYDNVLEHLVMHHSDYNFITTNDLLNYKVKINIADLNEFKTKRLKNRKTLGEPKYICLQCTMSYDNGRHFVRHLKFSHNVVRQECKSCNKHFETYRELHEHIKKKHNDINENFGCPGCKRTFNDVLVFRTHFKRHTENEIHNTKCPICSIVLYNLFSLKRHLLIHTGEKPHQCEKCELKFRDKRNLVAHMKAIHSIAHDLICNVCNQTFSCKEYLKRHMRYRHCKIV